jgi:hypothetical protein
VICVRGLAKAPSSIPVLWFFLCHASNHSDSTMMLTLLRHCS